MSEFKLEVGKQYLCQNGTTVTVKKVTVSQKGSCIILEMVPEEVELKPKTMQVEDVPERERIMDYLQGCVNVNNVVWTYEQLCLLIEGYLKYRESEK